MHDHHHHHHDHGPGTYDRAFAIGIVLNGGFVAVEVAAGLVANSVALLADAAHNLGDVLGLMLAWGAAWLGQRPPTGRRTYGYGRSSILASLTNAVVLLISVGAIAVEAVQRFADPVPVGETTVMVTAGIGILINGVTAWLFFRGRKGDLNIRGAFLHMAADAAVSAGVVLGALLIVATGWLWLDPLTSLAIAAVITIGTWELLRDSVDLAMDAVPAGIATQEVHRFLVLQPGVQEVHDLHIWGLSTTQTALTAHLVCRPDACDATMLHRISVEIHDRFGIDHTTLQIETEADAAACRLRPEAVI